MPAQVTSYKCPSCTGPLHYVGASGKLECDYCGSSYDVSEIETLYAGQEQKAASAQWDAEEKAAEENRSQSEWDTSGFTDDWGADAAGMKAYLCPSCGAELICDSTTAATSCPYCGNPAVVPGQFSGALKPEFVIPFKLSKEDAVAALKKHYKDKPFLPKSFTDENHIQEIRGVYVPYWLFDGAAVGSARFEATRETIDFGEDADIIYTHHFDVYRKGSLAFEKVPVDASSKMPDHHMDSIEPYDYSELKPFSTAYLPGFLANQADVSMEDCQKRADVRCENTLTDALRNTVGIYHTCVCVNHSADLQRGKVHYALLPVWMLNTKWNGENYLFAMNGQTGKLVGDLPIDKGRFWARFAQIAGVLSILGTVISLVMVR